MRAEVFVDVFECATGGFGEEEIYDWYEAEVEDGPDDVEAPAESADSDGGDFYDLLGGGLVLVSFSFFFLFFSPLWFENECVFSGGLIVDPSCSLRLTMKLPRRRGKC